MPPPPTATPRRRRARAAALAAATPRRRRARAAALATALSCGALAFAGCGGSSHSDGTEADPAGAVPADAALYLGATVRPTGSAQSGVEAAGRELTGRRDPFAELVSLLQTPGSAKLDYKRDIAPWLGPHAGLFIESLGSAEAAVEPLLKGLAGGAASLSGRSLSSLDGALVMDTSDAAAARSFLAGQAKRAGARSRSYRGVSYEVGDGTAFALVGRFAVIGGEAAVRRVIGVTQGEAALSSESDYTSLAAGAPGGALAHVFMKLAATGSQTAGGAAGTLGALVGGARALEISLLASAGSLSADVQELGASAGAPGLLSYDPEAAAALEALPAESWLALGIGHAGSALPSDVAALKALAGLLGSEGGSLSLGSVLGGLIKPLSVLGAPTAAAQRRYRSWMGRAGIFGAGSSVLELKAGVEISSTDAAGSRAAVSALAAALRAGGGEVTHASIDGAETAAAARLQGLPLPLYIAAGPGPGGPEFVLGLGEASVQAALAPSQTLASSSARASAASSLGEGVKPSLIADVPALLSLLESVGLTEAPSLKTLVPYLRATTTVAGGGSAPAGSSEVQRFKLVVGLKQ